MLQKTAVALTDVAPEMSAACGSYFVFEQAGAHPAQDSRVTVGQSRKMSRLGWRKRELANGGKRGATSSLPRVLAKVGLLNSQPTLSLGGGNHSSCPLCVIRGRDVELRGQVEMCHSRSVWPGKTPDSARLFLGFRISLITDYAEQGRLPWPRRSHSRYRLANI